MFAGNEGGGLKQKQMPSDSEFGRSDISFQKDFFAN